MLLDTFCETTVGEPGREEKRVSTHIELMFLYISVFVQKREKKLVQLLCTLVAGLIGAPLCKKKRVL